MGLKETLKELPTKLEGISSIEVLIIDNSSTAKTVSIARSFGAQHV